MIDDMKLIEYKSKYSDILEVIRIAGNVLKGHIVGTLHGTLDGLIGSPAIPTSTRVTFQDLEKNIDEVASCDDCAEGIGKFTHLYSRLVSHCGVHVTLLVKAIEDLGNGGDITYALILVPNAINAVYEVNRLFRNNANEETRLLSEETRLLLNSYEDF